MKLAFAGRWNPEDKTAWSGTYYSMWKQLGASYDAKAFYYKWPWHVRERLLLHKQFQKLHGKKAAVEFLTGYAKYFSRQLEKDLLKYKPDVIFCPGAPQLLAFCNTDIPVIYSSDATFFQLQGYYQTFSEIAGYNIKQGIALDKAVLEKASYCLMASEWAKNSAINDYNLTETKVGAAAYGANIDSGYLTADFDKPLQKCNLIFPAVEWERKGGSIALDTFYQLPKLGIDATLTIIGCIPPQDVSAVKNITVIPFLNKNIKAELEQFITLFQQSHFLLLPTRAECAGIVFSEASAMGIPSIATNTGGVSSYVHNGVNGVTLPYEATGEDYAKKIAEVFQNKEQYKKLQHSSRLLYENQLNWDCWGSRVTEKINLFV